MCGESNMETSITICKIDSQWELAVWLRKLKQGLCINLEGGMGMEMGGEATHSRLYDRTGMRPKLGTLSIARLPHRPACWRDKRHRALRAQPKAPLSDP